eukprot:Hpha_TRINITY_DN16882_c1_g1::TRINITY_DN16882_c1_g1_i1::g.150514::m.150514
MAAEEEKMRARYAQQMELRKEWLAEERGQLDRVERAMLELKALAAPYVAVGRREVMEPIERLADLERQLRKERLKGIPEREAAGHDCEWVQQRVDELWEEKLAFGARRKRWEELIEGCERELARAQDLAPPEREPSVPARADPPPPASPDIDLSPPHSPSLDLSPAGSPQLDDASL